MALSLSDHFTHRGNGQSRTQTITSRVVPRETVFERERDRERERENKEDCKHDAAGSSRSIYDNAERKGEKSVRVKRKERRVAHRKGV